MENVLVQFLSNSCGVQLKLMQKQIIIMLKTITTTKTMIMKQDLTKKNNNYDLLYKKKLEIITGVSRPNLKYQSDNHDQYAKPEAYQEVTHSSLNYLDEVRLYR